MKFIGRASLLAVLTLACRAQPAVSGKEVFREPFTLKLGVDDAHFYEQKIDRRIPYVHEDAVLLFCGERFGVKLTKSQGRITHVTYEPDEKAADLFFVFHQEKVSDHLATLLEIKNHTGDTVYLDAAMVVLNRQTPVRTSLLPVQAGITSYEMWPHPIVQLMVHDIRLTKDSPKAPTVPGTPQPKSSPQRGS